MSGPVTKRDIFSANQKTAIYEKYPYNREQPLRPTRHLVLPFYPLDDLGPQMARTLMFASFLERKGASCVRTKRTVVIQHTGIIGTQDRSTGAHYNHAARCGAPDEKELLAHRLCPLSIDTTTRLSLSLKGVPRERGACGDGMLECRRVQPKPRILHVPFGIHRRRMPAAGMSQRLLGTRDVRYPRPGERRKFSSLDEVELDGLNRLNIQDVRCGVDTAVPPRCWSLSERCRTRL